MGKITLKLKKNNQTTLCSYKRASLPDWTAYFHKHRFSSASYFSLGVQVPGTTKYHFLVKSMESSKSKQWYIETCQLFAIGFPALLIKSKIEIFWCINTRLSPWLFFKAINVNIKYVPENIKICQVNCYKITHMWKGTQMPEVNYLKSETETPNYTGIRKECVKHGITMMGCCCSMDKQDRK